MPTSTPSNSGGNNRRRGDARPYTGHGRGRDGDYDLLSNGRSVQYTAGFAGDRGQLLRLAPVGEVTFSTSASEVIAHPSERRTFPSRSTIRDACTHRVGDITRVISKAHWWNTESIRDRQLIAYYENADGLLPDGLPGSIVESFDFHRRCLVPDGDLLPGRANKPARIKHIMEVYARFSRMPCAEPIPATYGMDLYCYRTSGEVEVVEHLGCLEVEKWSGVRDVAQEALCCPRSVLRADFRYERKADSPYWTWAKWERRMRRNDDLLVSYHCVEYQNIRPGKRIGRWPRNPPGWEDVEVSAALLCRLATCAGV